MRAFSTFIIAAAFILTANAGAINRRAVSAPVQRCIDDIKSVAAQLSVVESDVDSLTDNSGYANAFAILGREQVLETRLKKAGTDCCAVPDQVSDEEVAAVNTVIEALVPQVTATLESIVTKKPQFVHLLSNSNVVANSIKNLDTETKALDTCLVDKTPASYLDAVNALVEQINESFAAAKEAYGI